MNVLLVQAGFKFNDGTFHRVPSNQKIMQCHRKIRGGLFFTLHTPERYLQNIFEYLIGPYSAGPKRW